MLGFITPYRRRWTWHQYSHRMFSVTTEALLQRETIAHCLIGEEELAKLGLGLRGMLPRRNGWILGAEHELASYKKQHQQRPWGRKELKPMRYIFLSPLYTWSNRDIRWRPKVCRAGGSVNPEITSLYVIQYYPASLGDRDRDTHGLENQLSETLSCPSGPPLFLKELRTDSHFLILLGSRLN